MSSVHSFVENAVWDQSDRLRPLQSKVTFRIVLGELREDFVGDYSVFYDPNDEILIEMLGLSFPGLAWNTFVYWKNQSRAEIILIDPMSDEQVGMISLRGNGSATSGERDLTNVVSLRPKMLRQQDRGE